MSEWAPNPRPFPYVFYGVQGNDMRAVESPSFLNHHEANVIADLITALLKRTDLAITTNDFGVICAYWKQVRGLRTLLRGRGLGNVRVGITADYQGQQEKIIIISTVLSKNHGPGAVQAVERARAVEVDGYAPIGAGLLGEPKKFNVALTRAQALVIIVGDPWILYHDPCWRRVIATTVTQGSYRGCPCEPFGVGWDGVSVYDEEDEDSPSLRGSDPGARVATAAAALGYGHGSSHSGPNMYFSSDMPSRMSL